MKKPIMGIQLYTLRDYIRNTEDFDNTLKRLKEMGVNDVQISGIGDVPPAEQKAALDKYGIKVCVTHKSFDDMKNALNTLMADHKTIECDAIGIGSAPGDARGTKANVLKFIDTATEIGEKMKAKGFTFNYHNHDFEFYRLADHKNSMMDFLLEKTNPETFKFIPDVGWMHYAGQNPAEMLKKMAGRVKVIHFKDYVFDDEGNRHFVPLGQGVVNLEECYKVACEFEIPYIVYEHDNDWPENDPFLGCEMSWKYLMELQNKF